MKRAVRWAILYAVVIISLSSVPGKNFPEAAWLAHDKVIHFGEYGLFGFLVAKAMNTRVTASGRIFLITLLLAGLFGMLDELYQSIIPGRDSSVNDWIADVAGILLGSGVYIWLKYRRDQTTVH